MNDQAREPCTHPANMEPTPSARLPTDSTAACDRVCPFCDQAAGAARCGACGRDPTSPRIVCVRCNKLTPSAEPDCCRCGERRRDELQWKVPLIIAIFVVALSVGILANMLLDRALR